MSAAARAYVPPPGSAPTLDVPDPTGWRRVHVIGIGGAGMRQIARILMARGVEVTGSDLKETGPVRALRREGAAVHVPHHPDHVGEPDAVVISSAIPAVNSELRAARDRGLVVLTRAQALAAIVRGSRAIAVGGSHGKTTTTSMIAVILDRAGLDPSFLIGGDLNEIGSGAGHGAGEAFVVEADESDGTFLLLDRDIAVITNVDEEHHSFYPGGRAEVEAAFAAFARAARRVVACGDEDAGVRQAMASEAVPVLWYGFGEDNDLVVRPDDGQARGARAVASMGEERAEIVLDVPGRMNLLNAAAAVGVATLLGVPFAEAARAVGAFTGVRRRFERKGEVRGAVFVDDYAHHPTEVAATLEIARGRGRRLVAVFQPHRYSRTEAMWRQMGQSLVAADAAVVTDVYGASEPPVPGVTGKLVVNALAEAAPRKRIVYLPHRSQVAPFLLSDVREGDLVVTLGCGDITMVWDEVQTILAGEPAPASAVDDSETEV
jgi:UDP-N-acetylmuramate--alanine ligase